jgi:hypothetical protein
MEGYALLSSTLRDCLSRLLSNLKNTADSVYRGLDIKFVKEEVLYLIKVYSRPVVKELKQSLSSRNVSKPQHYTKTTY